MRIIKAIKNLFNSDKQMSKELYNKGYIDGFNSGWTQAMSKVSKAVDDFLKEGSGK
jgi:hypothetical protein|tara:strand:+ start:1908 stop:2075 length:168 start_codon:yes stop_codon:yes gene_type:complete